MIKYYLFILVQIIIIIIIIKFTLNKYIIYCKNCVKQCVIFSEKNMKECINICYCINIKPNYKKNNIIKYEENLDCKNGYADIPKIKIKNTSLKPNIILFVLDDLDEIISPYFDAMPFARELFKINGTHFRNGFTSTSFCSPSRSQILTGLYGHNNGNIGMVGKHGGNSAFRNPYHLNGTKMKDGEKCINNENRTLAIFLQKYAGYHTSIIGKYLNGIENIKTRKIDYIPIGWNDFHIGSDPFMYLGYGYTLTNYSSSNKILTYEYYGFNEEDYITDVISKKTINIIDKNNNKPLFMYIAPSAPHFPLPCAERHKHLLTFWNDQYDKYVSNRPNNYFVGNSKPEWIINNAKKGFSDSAIKWNKLDWKKRMTTLYSVDDAIKNIYNKIKEKDKLNNTIFILLSDNGYNLGAHGLYNKMTPNEESIRIPYYISGLKFNKNKISDELVSLIDILPTILDLTGFEIPKYIDGKSLIHKKNYKNRESLLLQFKNNILYDKNDILINNPELISLENNIPNYLLFDPKPYIAIRTNDCLFVKNNINNSLYYELYNITTDPYQLYNIINNKTIDMFSNKLHNLINYLE